MTNNKFELFNWEQKEIAQIAKVLSHPARIAFIQILAPKKEIKTGNISNFLPISRTTVSQHLKELKNAGIIQGTIDGLKIHYYLNNNVLNEINIKLNNFLSKSINHFSCDC